MNIQLTPETLFAKYGQKCLECDALRERISELEQLLEAQRGVAAHNNATAHNEGQPVPDADYNELKEDLFSTRQHTNGV